MIDRIALIPVLIAILFPFSDPGARAQLAGPATGGNAGLAKGQVRIGGHYKPSVTGGTPLRVLVVYARFRDDTVSTPTWPDPLTLPEWAGTVLEKNASSIGKHPRNLSQYFRENSNSRFTLVGDVYYVTTDSTETYYHERFEGREEDRRGAVVREVLEKLADPRGRYKVDFRRYDNWTYKSEYAHKAGRDGNVDMIWFLTRSYHQNPYASSDARGGRYREFYRTSADFNVRGGPLAFNGVRVHQTNGDVAGVGSGVMVFAANSDKQIYVFDSLATGGGPRLYGELIHEMSHYFFGPGHIGNSDVTLSPRRYTSYLSGYSVNNGNAFSNFLGYEKLRMGWLDDGRNGGVRTLGPDEKDVTVTLADPSDLRRGAVHLLRIPLAPTGQYLLLESRGWRGAFEARFAAYNAAQARLVPGVLVTHVEREDDYFANSRVRVVCADGLFRWKVLRRAGKDENEDRMTVIARDSADAVNGYDERERIVIDGSPNRFWLAGYWSNGPGKPAALGPYPDCTNCVDTLTDAGDNVGDRYDLFQPGDVLTPWSNPALSLWNGRGFSPPEGPSLGVHIVSADEAAGSYTLRIVRGDLSSLPPSKPTGLVVERGAAACPQLRWSPNREPKMNGPGAPALYVIERSFDGNQWSKAAQQRYPACSYRDDCGVYPSSAERVYFRVRVIDNAGRGSRPSEPQSLRLR